jgi:hypothetical protein
MTPALDSSVLDLALWVQVLVGLALFVVLMAGFAAGKATA